MGLKIMVVDDERDVEMLFRQRFRRELRSGELELLFAFSGEEALQVLTGPEKADVVLVLSDINMPGMTGLELLCRIKAEPPPVPVCMMTANGNEEYRRRAEACDCDGYLTKPLDFNALKDRIRSMATVVCRVWEPCGDIRCV
jgi:CheY-like chemotaxis protein